MRRFHELPDPRKDWLKKLRPTGQCICQALYISVPAGEHAHINCPVHGDVVIHGSTVSF